MNMRNAALKVAGVFAMKEFHRWRCDDCGTFFVENFRKPCINCGSNNLRDD